MRLLLLGLCLLATPAWAQVENRCQPENALPPYLLMPDDAAFIFKEFQTAPTAPITIAVVPSDGNPTVPIGSVSYPASAWTLVAPNCYRAVWVRPTVSMRPGEPYRLVTQGEDGLIESNDFVMCRGAVRLAVADWTRTVTPANSGRALFRLSLSQAPVATVIIRLNGVEALRFGPSPVDLRQLSGLYFPVPSQTATYAMTLEAQGQTGCAGSDTRPMSVIVTK